MKLSAAAALAAVMFFGTMIFGTAIAQEEVEREIEVKVIMDGDGADDTSAIRWASKGMAFDMQDMAVGETRVIDGESGHSASVTRHEDGYSFDIDGKTIKMPNFGAEGVHMAFASSEGLHENVNIDIMNDDIHGMKPHMADGVTIISSTPLDNSVRESIKSVLISAGNNDEVTFIDGNQVGMRVIKMKTHVEVTE